MQLPPTVNMTQAEVLAIIEDVVNHIAPAHVFPGVDTDDALQVVRIRCPLALERFDPAKGCLRHFLATNLRRRLTNWRRDSYRRSDPPCKLCAACDREGRRPDHHDTGDYCRKHKAWASRNASKACLQTAVQPEYDGPVTDMNRSSTDDTLADVEARDLIQYIGDRLTPDQRRWWIQMSEDYKSVPPERRRKLERIIREICEAAGADLPDLSPVRRAS